MLHLCHIALLAVLLGCGEDQAMVKSRETVEHGILLSEEGKLAEAKAAFRKAIELDSTSAEAHFRLGYMYEIADSLADAAREYATAIRLKPDMAVAHHNFGLLLAKGGDFERAVREFELTIQLNAVDPDTILSPMPYYCLGLIYSAQGKDERAIEVHRKAIELNPNLIFAHSELGEIYMKRGQLEAAEEVFKQALALKEDFVPAHYNLVTVYMRMKRPDAGAKHRKLFEKYRETEPEEWQRFRGR